MVCDDILKIKNLPKELTDAEKEEFLKHFGSSKVRVITSKAKQKSVVYAKFDSKEVAREVLYRLHQTYILKNRLCVEYAEHEIGLPKIKKLEETPTSTSKEHFKSFIKKLNSFNNHVDFQQPPLPFLKYTYPKANRPTINNIGHALATVPKFYIQVLHLMNRMNLPPPFAVPEPLRTSQPQPQVKTTKSVESESESELESDEESKNNPDIIPQKRKIGQKKIVKRPKFIKPNPSSSVSSNVSTTKFEDVFEKPDIPIHKKIELKVPSTVLEQKSDAENSEENNQETERSVISDIELSSNQISEKEFGVLPVFKNYHPGVPSCRLYIKNISKNVTIKDLEYIYNRYKMDSDDAGFEIRLMQEGRMKGQAFITLASVEIAQKALKDTNAFILKEKPLVVVFAKSVPAKK